MDDTALRTILKSQYHAALAMLRGAIEACPDDLWLDTRYRNSTWQIAYHALFFAHFYSCTDEASFVPWVHHRADCQVPDGIPGPPDPESDLPLVADPYARALLLEYADFCDEFVETAIDEVDLGREECGFPWYPVPKLEHLLVNLRHIQHHAANIAERLRTALDIGVPWAGARRPS